MRCFVEKQCFLILVHKKIDGLTKFFFENREANFYIHVDLKSDFYEISKDFRGIDNIFFINNRVDIKWGGFSMVQATINLISFALEHDKKNEYFHLISGDDVFLNKNLSWEGSDIFIECRESIEHRYRMRFDTPHADTKYQRTLLGKALTQFYKKTDKIFPTREKFYFGSQWFSIRRNELEILMNSITESDLNFFKKKLCQDEHFFQYLVVKNKMLNKVSIEGNKRYIFFDKKYQRGSSPIFLNLEQLEYARDKQNWFARKVEAEVMSEFYNLQYDE